MRVVVVAVDDNGKRRHVTNLDAKIAKHAEQLAAINGDLPPPARRVHENDPPRSAPTVHAPGCGQVYVPAEGQPQRAGSASQAGRVRRRDVLTTSTCTRPSASRTARAGGPGRGPRGGPLPVHLGRLPCPVNPLAQGSAPWAPDSGGAVRLGGGILPILLAYVRLMGGRGPKAGPPSRASLSAQLNPRAPPPGPALTRILSTPARGRALGRPPSASIEPAQITTENGVPAVPTTSPKRDSFDYEASTRRTHVLPRGGTS
ncbi:hypothetical protein GCM10020219_032480 [Nonomuraea dietziae]